MTPQEQRTRILQALYEERNRSSWEVLDSEDLVRLTGIPLGRIRHEIIYLEDKGYIASKSRLLETRIITTLHLTTEGIDVLEGRVSDESVVDTPTKRLSQLLENLVKYYNLEEFLTLCFDLGVNYDNLHGEGIEAKARELLAFLDRRGRIPELIEVCSKLRPSVSWGETV